MTTHAPDCNCYICAIARERPFTADEARDFAIEQSAELHAERDALSDPEIIVVVDLCGA